MLGGCKYSMWISFIWTYVSKLSLNQTQKSSFKQIHRLASVSVLVTVDTSHVLLLQTFKVIPFLLLVLSAYVDGWPSGKTSGL